MKAKTELLQKPRNLYALHPLLHKGGVHHAEKVDVARMRERKQIRQQLRHKDWLSEDNH